MKALYVVVLFPLIAGLGWGVAKALLSLVYRQRAFLVMMQESGWLHLLFVSIPTSVVLAEAARTGTLERIGLRWPQLLGLPVWLAVALVSVLAVASGVLVYVNELALSARIRRLLSRRKSEALQTLVQGGSAALWLPEAPPFANFMAASALTSFAEELVWRGFVIDWARGEYSLPLALLASGLSFGINHSYFGFRNVMLKTLDGVVWGLLLLATGSVLAPFLSHLTFQYLVWRRLDRRHRQAAASANVQVPAAGGFRSA
jgi:membrane protease YdiL (CAAX protease family)